MSALAKQTNPIYDAIKPVVNRLLWVLFDEVKDDTIPVHISVFHIPLNVSIKIANLESVIEILVGPRPETEA